jgi:hypothetical protein
LVSSEEVREYLRFHKTFLEEFLLENVPQESLERVLIKAQRKSSASGTATHHYFGWWPMIKV